MARPIDTSDRPVPVTRHTTVNSPGACSCNGIGGTHTLGQPGCNNS